MMTVHITHVERDTRGRFYWWCEEHDCGDRGAGPPYYRYQVEAFDAARHHEDKFTPKDGES
jgi:hypothetical protein